MVSIIPTTQPDYKVQWCSAMGNFFMDKGRSDQTRSTTTTTTGSPKHPAPLTDPTSLQSSLPLFPVPSQSPLDLRLPDTRLSRKRKASQIDESTMSQPPYQRIRGEEQIPPPTIDPSTLTTPFASPSQYSTDPYSNMPAATTSFGTWQPMPPRVRTSSTPTESFPNQYAYHPWGSISSDTSIMSQSPSHGSSATTTASQHVGMYANPMQPVYPAAPYTGPVYHHVAPPTYPGTNDIPPTLRSTHPSTQRPPTASSYAEPVPTTRPPQRSSDAQRPKPQCWEHGCNGREFSTFSNLLRHQRERSGTAPRSYCPRCGAEFTRSTARTNHLINSKCKPRRGSD